MSLSDSPFVNRLNTNYVPSESEILQIRALLVDPMDELARVDSQIEVLEITLGQLKERRAVLQEPIDAHRALISPMRLIPHDVLLEIFFACLPTKHNALIDHNEAPLLLGCICRHWRDVTYSTPMLWSSIHIPFLHYLSTPSNILLGLEKIVAGWLARSATCPPSVSLFDFANRVESNPTLKDHPIVLQLLAVSHRLHRLGLAGDAEFLRPLLRLGPEDVPLLKRVQVETMAYQMVPSMNILRAPTLEDVKLASALGDPLSLPLQWSQLTSLRLQCYECRDGVSFGGGLDFDGALDVLRKCPNLEQCEIEVTKSSAHLGLTRDLPPIILPRLHNLLLGGWHFLLENWSYDLVAPNLRFIQIGQDNIIPSGLNCLRADIDPIRFTLTGLHEFLQSFPMISHLRLTSAQPPPDFLDDEFIGLLCSPHNLCPMLTDINLWSESSSRRSPYMRSVRFSDAAVLAFIKARMAMPIPLRRFRVQFARPMVLDIMPELQSFISDGLQITLEYPPQSKFMAQDGLAGPRSMVY
ncbi:Hexose carrier protein [Mycena sanguinolenta]|uniref:Hexose carrier protein n=1 Tax=Mycena sanguinolenta TaxID=230812 RepID=A0A8H6XXR4_9AGAR|nr:Hexose carrier protein [Mycena sanguinolenta]